MINQADLGGGCPCPSEQFSVARADDENQGMAAGPFQVSAKAQNRKREVESAMKVSKLLQSTVQS